MATRQYIGARYVIKIYENTQNPSSAEWQSGTSYEPLTMVTYQNSSYLSKKAVPSTVGNPASNADYWVVTGAYNGQIANLQQQIDAINTLLDGTVTRIEQRYTMADRKFILISDSYGALTQLYNYFVTYLGLTTGQYSINVESGDSFVGSAITGKFINRLADGIDSFDDADEITDIVVLGGLNDSTEAYNDTGELLEAMQAFNTYAKAYAPNAKIHLGYIGYCDISSSASASRTWHKQYITCRRYIENAGSLGWHYITNIEYSIRGVPSLLGSDGVHPSEEGAMRIAKNASIGLNGSCDCKYVNPTLVNSLTAQTPTNCSSAPTVLFNCYAVDNGVTSFVLTVGECTFNYDSENVNLMNLQVDIPITDYPLAMIENTTPYAYSGSCSLAYKESAATKFMECPATVYLLEDKIRIKPYPFINGDNNWRTVQPLSLSLKGAVSVELATMKI